MAKRLVFLLAVVTGLSFFSCATYSTRGGVPTPLGGLTAADVNSSRTVIAEYTIILGLITSGYEKFLEDTKGRDIDIVDTNYFSFYRIVKAVARE
jgi:hypothetical protein